MTEPADFYILSWGLVATSVCTSLPIRQATARLNAELPTGISSRWRKSSDKAFAGGERNGMRCPDLPEHRHYLFTC